MLVTVRCPHCQSRLGVEDAHGDMLVACQTCGKQVRLPTIPPADSSDARAEPEALPQPRRKPWPRVAAPLALNVAQDRPGWRRVLWGLPLLALGLLLLALGGLWQMGALAFDEAMLTLPPAQVALGVLGVGAGLILLGQALCFRTPRFWGLILASTITLVPALILGGVAVALPMILDLQWLLWPRLFGLVAGALFLPAHLLQAIYLRQLSNGLSGRPCARWTLGYLIVFPALAGFGVILQILTVTNVWYRLGQVWGQTPELQELFNALPQWIYQGLAISGAILAVIFLGLTVFLVSRVCKGMRDSAGNAAPAP